MIRARCEVLSSRRTGAFHTITVVAPDIAERARPGQFVQVAVPDNMEFFLRRPFFLHQASRRGGWAGTVEFAVELGAPGTDWLTRVQPHQFLDLIGPLGTGFSLPAKPTNCLLVSVGRGAAPVYFLAQELRAHGRRVDMVVGGPDQDRVFHLVEAKRLSRTVTIVTEDGSLGERGQVVDVLPGAVTQCGAEVIYAAGPRDVLRAVAAYCREQGIPSQVAVEERMACGLGLCFSCVVPVIRRDGRGYHNLRTCVEGPVFNSARILWDRWMSGEDGTVPGPPEGSPAVGASPE